MKIAIDTNIPKTKWIQFIERNRYKNHLNPPDALEIDLNPSSFIEPFYLVSLACMIEEYSINGTQISFSSFDKLELREYLLSGCFFDYWNSGFNRYENYFKHPKSTMLRLWKIEPSAITEYVEHAQKYYQARFFQEKDTTPINVSLAELFNNIIDHSESAISGFVLSQYYPQNGKLKIVICDFGVGIAKKINTYLVQNGQKAISNKAAILKAFEFSFSSKSSPQNRGWGLTTLKEIVDSCNGTLRLISNRYNLSYNIDNQKQFTGFPLEEQEFCGTLFEVILDTESFDLESKEEFDLDF